MANSVKLRHLTRSERRVLVAKLNDRTLRVRVHRRVIAESARGRPMVEVADRIGCHVSMAYEWIHRSTPAFHDLREGAQSQGPPMHHHRAPCAS